MRKRAIVVITVVLTCLFSTQGVFAWGSLTHAYITSQIVAEDGTARNLAIYGSTVPDFANYMFSSPYQGYLMDRTHSDFLRVWKMASGGPAHVLEQAAAFGFVAHNDEDYTAHFSSLTLDPGAGYVVQKAAYFDQALMGAGVWTALGLADDTYAPLRAELSHEVIEFAGDYLVAEMMGSGTGQVLSDAASGNYGEFPLLLTRAYAGNLVAYSNGLAIRLNQPSAASILAGNELIFRGGMVGYGNLFTGGDPATVLGNLALYLQQLAGTRGIQIEDVNLVAQVLGFAVETIQGDFPAEIQAAIPFVAGRLAQQRIAY